MQFTFSLSLSLWRLYGRRSSSQVLLIARYHGHRTLVVWDRESDSWEFNVSIQWSLCCVTIYIYLISLYNFTTQRSATVNSLFFTVIAIHWWDGSRQILLICVKNADKIYANAWDLSRIVGLCKFSNQKNWWAALKRFIKFESCNHFSRFKIENMLTLFISLDSSLFRMNFRYFTNSCPNSCELMTNLAKHSQFRFALLHQLHWFPLSEYARAVTPFHSWSCSHELYR